MFKLYLTYQDDFYQMNDHDWIDIWQNWIFGDTINLYLLRLIAKNTKKIQRSTTESANVHQTNQQRETSQRQQKTAILICTSENWNAHPIVQFEKERPHTKTQTLCHHIMSTEATFTKKNNKNSFMYGR